MSQRNLATEEEAKRFVKFNYPEVKDLTKHASTVMSGVLVFALTFGEKIVGPESPRWSQMCFGVALFLFLLGLIFAGRSSYLIYMAGEKANGPVVFSVKQDFRDLGQGSYNAITWGEIAYILGILLLVVSALPKYFT